MAELRAFENTARRLLDGAKAFEPDVGAQGRGELQLRTDLTRRAFYELIEALESVGVRVGATAARAARDTPARPPHRLCGRLRGWR